MRVRRITVGTGLSGHDGDPLHLNIPERGVMLVTGGNGVGKSRFIDALAWTIYGKPVRDAHVWRPKVACWGEVELDGAVIRRTRSKSGGTSGTITIDGARTEYSTEKALAAGLEGMVPPRALWERAAVFDPSVGARFSSAGDLGRKQLLEQVLGLEAYDGAAKQVRRDLREATREEASREAKKAAAAARVDALQEILDPPADLASLDAEIEKVEAGIGAADRNAAALQDDVVEVEVDYRAACAVESDIAAELRRAKSGVADVAVGVCPTCAQDVSAEYVEALNVDALAEVAKLHTRFLAASLVTGTMITEREKAREEVAVWSRKANKRRMALRDLRNDRRHAQAAQDKHERAAAVLAEARQAVKTAERNQSEASKRVILLTEVGAILGPKGYRATRLNAALAGLEAAANVWLRRLAPMSGWTIGLPEEGGGIGFAVQGLGKGRGYAAGSGGQRRRVDTALLLGLGQLAASVGELDPRTTLFLDEVLDALDEEGVDLVVDLVEEITEGRAGVLITHSPTLAAVVSADQRVVLG